MIPGEGGGVAESPGSGRTPLISVDIRLVVVGHLFIILILIPDVV